MSADGTTTTSSAMGSASGTRSRSANNSTRGSRSGQDVKRTSLLSQMDASVFTEEAQRGPTCQSAFKYRVFEVGLDAAVLGRHFVEANGDLALLDGTGDDVDVFGILALDLAEVLRVGAELEDRVHLGDARELRVLWFKGE